MTIYAVEATLPAPPEPDEESEPGRDKEERDESNRLSRIELHTRIGKNAELNNECLWPQRWPIKTWAPVRSRPA